MESKSNQNRKMPDKPAQAAGAQNSARPGQDAGKAPTNGATMVDHLQRGILTESARIHHRMVMESLDSMMNLPGLSKGIQTQLLIAWLMVHYASLPYHQVCDPVFSDTLLDEIKDMLGRAIRGDDQQATGSLSGEADTETTVLPQPSGSPAAKVIAVEVPKPEEPRPSKSPKRPMNGDPDKTR
jgi:hypothetical protein